jgi:hypothetical protein
MEDKNDVPLGGFMSYLRYLCLLAHSGFLRLGYPMLPVSLDFPFTLPLRYSPTCICPVSCVPYVASFS